VYWGAVTEWGGGLCDCIEAGNGMEEKRIGPAPGTEGGGRGEIRCGGGGSGRVGGSHGNICAGDERGIC
jgi:hypothetical protein